MPRAKSKTQLPAAVTDPVGAEFGMKLLRWGFGKVEMGGWGLDDHQVDLATRCKVYKELVRPRGGDPLYSLTAIWGAAGSPPEMEPRAYAAETVAAHAVKVEEARLHPDPDMVKVVGEVEVEDRGEAGVFADQDTAAWYAHQLDPSTFTVEEVCELLY